MQQIKDNIERKEDYFVATFGVSNNPIYLT